jgi:hypothetical protein
LVWEFLAASILPFMSTNVTPQKRDGRKFCVEVFSQELEEMHQELSKDGENHKLENSRGTPLNQSFSRFAHVYSMFFEQHKIFA